MDNEIPRLRPPHEMPPIITEHDLQQHWRALMGPLGFGQTRLWVILIDPDGFVLPSVVVLEENSAAPDHVMIDNLTSRLREVLDDAGMGVRIAALWTRPGRGSMRGTDRAWLRALHQGFACGRLDAWPLHFANDAYLRIVAPDDLAA